ncbi:MAG: phage holin family protein [Bacteroidales bacterium]|nr:phage holin family protein [Bacteroidales bacterium]MDY3912210.1 phage holin family protein [Sodaliphilus sp.]
MIATLLISALAVGITAWLLPGVGIDSWLWTIVIALVLGVINTVVKPVVKLLALPVNLITLGLFSFVINALMIELCAAVVPAFHVSSFMWAMAYSVVLAIVTWLLGIIFDR